MDMAEIRLALRVTVQDYDSELSALADAALADLAMAGITSAACTLANLDDALVGQAVKTYIRAHFGSPSDYDRLSASYDVQKSQLMHATGHTDWGRADEP